MAELGEGTPLDGGESWHCAVIGASEAFTHHFNDGYGPNVGGRIDWVEITDLRPLRYMSGELLKISGVLVGGDAVNGHRTRFERFVPDGADEVVPLNSWQTAEIRRLAHRREPTLKRVD